MDTAECYLCCRDYEHTLDELDIIQGYVQQQAGHTCDIILGMGHDPNLEDKIAVTIIATGFNHKDITESMPKISDEPKKIVVELGQKDAERLIEAGATEQPVKAVAEDPYAPRLVEYKPVFQPIVPAAPPQQQPVAEETKTAFTLELPKAAEVKEVPPVPTASTAPDKEKEADISNQQFELIIKNTEPAAAQEEPVKIGDRVLTAHELEERRRFEEQKKALEERAERLRRMSFNIPNPEQADAIENIPAYQRRNMNVDDNAEKSNENFLSGYTVKNDGTRTNISSINTFLDGNKPD